MMLNEELHDGYRKNYWQRTYLAKIQFGKGGLVYNQLKARLIMSFLAKYGIDNSRVLAVGDGMGFMTNMMRIFFHNIYPVSTDYSQSGPKIANMIFKLKSLTCNANALPFKDKSFDVITVIDVLEHVSPKIRIGFFEEAKRVLEYPGILIIDIPLTKDYHWEGAVWRIDPYDIQKLIVENGFELIERIDYEKQNCRKASFMLARLYCPDQYWLDNKEDVGYGKEKDVVKII